MSSATSDPTDLAISATLGRNWWAVVLRGVIAIIFGVIALFWPQVTILSLVIVFAAYALVDGVLSIIASVRAMASHERWALLLLEGIVDIIAAAVAVAWPGMTVIVFVYILAAWAIVTGILALGTGFRLHVNHGRWWLIIGGLISVIYGILLLFEPVLGAVVLTWWLGAYAIVFGVMLIVLGFRLRSVAA